MNTELADRVDQIIPKLNIVHLDALHKVSRGRVHEVRHSTLRFLSRMDVIRISGVYNAGNPTSGWTTALGDAVLAQVAGETHE